MARTLYRQEDVALRGNLKATPEVSYTREGKPMATFSIAENKRVLDEQTGEWSDGEPVWHDAVAFGKLAEHLGTLKAGDTVIAVGDMKFTEYETREGEKRNGREFEVKDLGLSQRRYPLAAPAPKPQPTYQASSAPTAAPASAWETPTPGL